MSNGPAVAEAPGHPLQVDGTFPSVLTGACAASDKDRKGLQGTDFQQKVLGGELISDTALFCLLSMESTS